MNDFARSPPKIVPVTSSKSGIIWIIDQSMLCLLITNHHAENKWLLYFQPHLVVIAYPLPIPIKVPWLHQQYVNKLRAPSVRC